MSVTPEEGDVTFDVRRWAPAAGVIFALCVVVGAGLWDTPDYTAADSEWIGYFEDGGNRAAQIAAGYLFAVAGIALLVFVWDLSIRTAPDAPESPRLSTLAFACGLLVSGATFVAAAGAAAISGILEFEDIAVPSAELLITIEVVTVGTLLLGGGLVAALMVATLSRAAQRTESLPSWLVWVGYVLAIVLLFSGFFIPFFALPLWTLVVGGYLLVRPATP